MTKYIYGFLDDRQVLKTVSNTHTDLNGHLATVRETDVDTTEDFCKIVEKISSFDGLDGLCYDIYEIAEHYSIVDKTKPININIDQQRADIDYIAMETGVELED